MKVFLIWISNIIKNVTFDEVVEIVFMLSFVFLIVLPIMIIVGIMLKIIILGALE